MFAQSYIKIPGAMAFSSLRHSVNALKPASSPSNWALNVLSSPLSPRKRVIHIEKEMFSTNAKQTLSQQEVLKPLVVCGPSGVGKGTIIDKYMTDPKYRGSEKFGFTVSHTTRKPRPGEEDGIHYHFTSIPSIKAAIQSNKFLEFAEVHGNWYGTSIESLSFVQDKDEKIPLLDIDVQGVKNIKEWQTNQDLGENGPELGLPKLEAKFIFISPPSLETLKGRLVARGTETPESLEKRSRNALAELQYGEEQGNFDHIIINDDLDEACAAFSNAIDELYGNHLP